MASKPFAWCRLHHIVITRVKFNAKCRSAHGGARCHELTFKIPDYMKEKFVGTERHTRTRNRKRAQ